MWYTQGMLELRVFLGVFLGGMAATAWALVREPSPPPRPPAPQAGPAPAPLSELLDATLHAHDRGPDTVVEVCLRPRGTSVEITDLWLSLDYCWEEFDGVRDLDWFPLSESYDATTLDSLPFPLGEEWRAQFTLRFPAVEPERRPHDSWHVRLFVTADGRSGRYSVTAAPPFARHENKL